MKAILKTRCGCSQMVDIHFPPRKSLVVRLDGEGESEYRSFNLSESETSTIAYYKEVKS